MTDREILDSVHQMTKFSKMPISEIKSFIDKELQNQDHPLTKSDEGQAYNMNTLDVKEIERHRGLIIDESGTVTSLE